MKKVYLRLRYSAATRTLDKPTKKRTICLSIILLFSFPLPRAKVSNTISSKSARRTYRASMYHRCRVNTDNAAKRRSAGAAALNGMSRDGMRSAPSLRNGARRYKQMEVEESGGIEELRTRSSWTSDSSSVSSSSLEKSNDTPFGVSSVSVTRMSAAEESKPLIGEARPEAKESELVEERGLVGSIDATVWVQGHRYRQSGDLRLKRQLRERAGKPE